MGKLVLVRHGTSEYNAKGWWTGWDNPSLTDKGIEQAKKTGESLKDIKFDFAYASALDRAIETFHNMEPEMGQKIPLTVDKRLNERNYGVYTKKNKWEVQKEVGDAEFQKIRRGWDHPIPEGESLKQVYEREIPYFTEIIMPQVKSGKNVVIVSSGNAMRAIVKYLENISDDNISSLEFGLGEAYVYTIDENGKVTNKEIRSSNENKGKI